VNETPQTPEPPVARYHLTLTITGNTLDEIEREVQGMPSRFVLDSDYLRRDSWDITSGTATRVMEHRNPEMTPERYDAELRAWVDAHRAARREATR